MNVHKSLLWRIVFGLRYPCNLILIPDHFPRTAYQRHLLFLNNSQHYNSRKRLSSATINNPLHPLHSCIANALSIYRFSSKPLRCTTSLYRNFIIPSLARHLANPICISQFFQRSPPLILTFAKTLWMHIFKNIANFSSFFSNLPHEKDHKWAKFHFTFNFL